MNYDITNVVTPVDADKLNQLLLDSEYPDQERRFLVKGFKHGFSLGYQGPTNVKFKSPNLKFTIGDEV